MHRGFNASGSCSGEHGNVLAVGTYCYVAVCTAGVVSSAVRSFRRPQREERGGAFCGGRPPAACLVYSFLLPSVLFWILLELRPTNIATPIFITGWMLFLSPTRVTALDFIGAIGDILVPANTGSAGEMTVKTDKRDSL